VGGVYKRKRENNEKKVRHRGEKGPKKKERTTTLKHAKNEEKETLHPKRVPRTLQPPRVGKGGGWESQKFERLLWRVEKRDEASSAVDVGAHVGHIQNATGLTNGHQHEKPLVWTGKKGRPEENDERHCKGTGRKRSQETKPSKKTAPNTELGHCCHK